MANRLDQQMKDFARGGLSLFWQRQAMYLGAATLTATFVNVPIAAASFAACEIAELFDLYASRRVVNWNGQDPKIQKHLLNLLTFSSVLSSIVIGMFVVVVSLPDPGLLHYPQLFFLYSAGLFAAMNNHQVPRILLVRLSVYGAVFLGIPLWDIWVTLPNPRGEMWLQLGTSVFVLYFIVNCSLYFLRFYKNNLDRIDQMRTERDHAMDACEIQSQFVSVVSHELRTPLTSIRGALDLLNSGTLGEIPQKAGRITDIAHKNSQRLAALIDDLLDAQKFEAGKMEMNMSPVNLAVLVTDSVAANESIESEIHVDIRTEGTDRPVFVSGDYDRLMQVMTNILSNAIKFSKPGGTIDISLSTTEKTATISITDHGSGIPPNSKDKVFGRFLQIDSSDQRKVGGTGLGMHITKQIVERHGGKIDYESELGAGTTFIVELAIDTPVSLAIAS